MALFPFQTNAIKSKAPVLALDIVNRGECYETRQSSLFYVFVLFFGLDRAQNTTVV